jgi:nucleotide-binding universal stress UspA family protein
MVTSNPEKCRVFVGVDRSLPSLRALREAAAQARQRGAELHVVHVRRFEPASPPPAMYYLIASTPYLPQPDAWSTERADQPSALSTERADNAVAHLIVTCLQNALGAQPVDLDVHPRVLVGPPHRGLVSLACRDDDLLVVGTRGGHRRHHWRRRSVSRFCVAHATSPVLVVPCDEFARAMRPHRGGRIMPRDPWRDFDSTARSQPHPTY